MKFYADHAFRMGSSHQVCEDYSISVQFDFFNIPVSCTVVADGCSSAPHTDMGARILAWSALNTVKNQFGVIYDGYQEAKSIKDSKVYEILGRSIIDGATVVCQSMGNLPKDSLSATLMLTIVCEQFTVVFVYGDGSVLFKYKDTNLYELLTVDFESGAPYYLSYWNDYMHEQNYLEKFPGKKTLTSLSWDDKDSSETKADLDIKKILYFYQPTKNLELVNVFSDGLNTFKKRVDGIDQPIENFKSMVEELTNYKNPNGQFVQRRLTRLSKDYIKQGIHHYDDLSTAAVLIRDDK